MSYYTETFQRLKRVVYPNDYIVWQVIAAKKFMDAHYAEAIALDTIAREAFYSKFHFIRCFKSIYGRTPNQHLTSVRIEKAKQLLLTDDSVADVCYQVGFDSVTSFIGLFKKMTGMTPAGYRRKKQFSRTDITLQCGDLLPKL